MRIFICALLNILGLAFIGVTAGLPVALLTWWLCERKNIRDNARY